MCDQSDIDPAHCFACRVQHRRMGIEIIDVECVHARGCRSPDNEIGGDGFQTHCVTADEKQTAGSLCVPACGCFGYGGRGADDQNSLHGCSITRRQKPDENFGSIWGLKRSSCSA